MFNKEQCPDLCVHTHDNHIKRAKLTSSIIHITDAMFAKIKLPICRHAATFTDLKFSPKLRKKIAVFSSNANFADCHGTGFGTNRTRTQMANF